VPVSASAVTFTATPTNTAATTVVTYAFGASDIFSETPPTATLAGLTGSVTFRVKVTTTTEHTWGPYTFNVVPRYTVGAGLDYTTFEYGVYEGIKFTSGTGTLTFAQLMTVDLLVVGGGGGGQGRSTITPFSQMGGGGGGYTASAAFAITTNDCDITVGAGGAGGATDQTGGNGAPSSITPSGEAAISAAGGTGSGSQSDGGSTGTYNNITGTNTAYGGDGARGDKGAGAQGGANTGKGGGGGWTYASSTPAGAGGSGVVVIRWAK
jgi:hypothetical protein